MSTGLLDPIPVEDITQQAEQRRSGTKRTAEGVEKNGQGFTKTKYKTALCDNFLRGQCQYGGKCNFAHGEDELKKYSAQANANYKTSLCRSWKTGQCQFGEKCRFAHGDNELRAATEGSQMQSSPNRSPTQQQPRMRPRMIIPSNYERSPKPMRLDEEQIYEDHISERPRKRLRYAEDIYAENETLKLENTRLKAQIEILLKVRVTDVMPRSEPVHSSKSRASYYVGHDDYDSSSRYERRVTRRR